MNWICDFSAFQYQQIMLFISLGENSIIGIHFFVASTTNIHLTWATDIAFVIFVQKYNFSILNILGLNSSISETKSS
jgi:hypothetical protein